jgi:meso-butanediol dehydrogenase / (S,S)-butanediol dehydrogenase / diacetyl reductase
MRLNGKIAIITGAASGIGLATATLFAAEGAKVFGVDIQALPDGMTGRQIDLTEQGAEGAVFAACEAAFGAPDILFNNAGIGNARPILDTTDTDLARFLAANLAAPFRMARAAVASMRGRGGAIINTASIYGLRGAVSSAAYGPTKAAMIGMTMQLATEYGRDGIRVNAVAPGLIVTPMTAGRLANNPAFRDDMIGRTPLGHPGAPEDIAKAVLFLASDDARFITGVTLPVDGGWSVAGYLPPA